MLEWIWIALIVLAIVVEALTDQLISIWFVPGSIIATVLAVLDVHIAWQIVSVLVLAACGIVFAKTFLQKKLARKDMRTNIDAVIGERCVVTEDINNLAGCGQAKVRGQIWSARSVSDDDCFAAGDVLTVVAIEGVKLICKK